jgi:ubiquinone/menaquinone biosynthesis C-methylase UbiE
MGKAGRESWNRYWANKTFKKRIIEWLRRHYFANIYTCEVRRIVPKDATVLEAGCGSGTYLNLLQKSGYRCLGVDYSENSVRLMKDSLDKNAVQADIKCLPFKDKSFDLIFNQGVMEHFTDNDFLHIVREMKRVARNVLIIVPSNLSLFRLYDPFGDDPDKRFLNKRVLHKLMSQELKDVRVKYLWRSFFLSIAARGVV